MRIMDDNESMVHTRAKRALHYFVTTLILITVAVTSIIVAIWPQKQGIRSTLCDGKGAIPCRYVLTFFGDWEKFVEPDGHDHALVRSWSRTYRSLSRKHRAIVTGARTLLAAHAATPSQTFMLGEAWCEAHLQSFAPPLNTSLWRWFHNAKTSAPRRSELCRLGFLYAVRHREASSEQRAAHAASRHLIGHTPTAARPPSRQRGGFYMDMDLQPLYTGALHRHMHHWAGFVTVIAQGWAGLNATRGRKNRLSLRGSILGATVRPVSCPPPPPTSAVTTTAPLCHNHRPAPAP